MKVHGNARLLPRQRIAMCERVRLEGWSIAEVAEAFGVSERTVFRWLVRWDAGEPMQDRSSAPHRVPSRTPVRVVRMIERLRRLRWTSTRIAAELGMATSTVGAVLSRLGLNRRSRLGPLEPPNRYCPTPSRRSRARGYQVLRTFSPARTPRDRQPTSKLASLWLGRRARLHRRLHPSCLRRSAW
jgi:transposase